MVPVRPTTRRQEIAFLALAVLLSPAGLGSVAAAESRAEVPGWGAIVQVIGEDASLKDAVGGLVAKARMEMSNGLVRRARQLAEVGQNRTWLDGRSKALEAEIRETFALAMSDFAACQLMANTLPTLAAAARLSGDAKLRDHVVAQLEEMVGWSPLQRPGWTLYAPGHRLPKDGKDGNWLATGTGIRAVVTTLEIMGDWVGPSLREKLDKLLAGEIEGVVDDWQTKRPWFVRGNNPITNQWVLPTEGLVRACLWLGVEKHRDAYELGVKNLLAALSSHGSAGEFEEGIGYASFTVTSLFHAARAMAAAGDRRAIDHPFLANFPTWAVHHIQPGRMTVNCFDAGGAQIPRSSEAWRSMLSLQVFAGVGGVANWALWEQFDGPPEDLIGLACRAASRGLARTPPPLFAAYERAPMVVWRDDWSDTASGVWVRGGHRLDQHDHEDRGHVNVIFRGKPILIEAGTPSYSNPDMGVHYASGAGHNVLQVGTFFPDRPYPVQATARCAGWQQPGGVAPITVHRLDAKGGSVLVDGSRCYPEVERWGRRVDWSGDRVVVRDEVVLKAGRQDEVLFRWHVGAEKPVTVSGEGSRFGASWEGGQIAFESDAPLQVSQHSSPDATMAAEDHQHTCLEVRSREKVKGLMLVTSLASP